MRSAKNSNQGAFENRFLWQHLAFGIPIMTAPTALTKVSLFTKRFQRRK
jgi:hypothetical protein